MRRSVRNFTDEKIPDEEISEMLDYTKYCPSAKNQRGIQIAVLGRQVLDELQAVALATLQNNPVIQAYTERAKSEDHVFRGAQHCVIAIGPRNFKSEDGVIALATFELIAQAKGYGTFWCGFLKSVSLLNDEIKHIIGLPDDLEIVGAMCLGKPAVTYFRPAARKDITDIKFVD